MRCFAASLSWASREYCEKPVLVSVCSSFFTPSRPSYSKSSCLSQTLAGFSVRLERKQSWVTGLRASGKAVNVLATQQQQFEGMESPQNGLKPPETGHDPVRRKPGLVQAQ